MSEDFDSSDSEFVSVKKGDVVEVLDASQTDAWLVRCVTSATAGVGYVRSSVLQPNLDSQALVSYYCSDHRCFCF